MGTPTLTPPPPPAAGGAPPTGAPGPGGGAGGMSGSLLSQFQGLTPPQKLAFIAMAADKTAADSGEIAPMMRAIGDQVRQASVKLIQQRQSAQQVSPQI